MARARKEGMTSREKKIFMKKVEDATNAQMVDAWKMNLYKDLDSGELEQFDIIRKEYKKRTGFELGPHSNKRK